MLTKVKGKIIENTYSVNNNRKEVTKDNKTKSVYTARPELIKKTEFVSWENICEFSGKPYYNSDPTFILHHTINISEDEEVYIVKEIFRADLNELHLFTNKTIKESDVCKEKFEAQLKQELANFNEQMIESNDRLLSYCKLHKLNPRATDVIELFKLVYGHSNYTITDGVMSESYLSYITTAVNHSHDYDIGTINTLSTSISTDTLYEVSGTTSNY